MKYVRTGPEDDEEICRTSSFATRTRKLSSCADGSWGFPLVCVGRRQSQSKVIAFRVVTFFMF